MAIVKGSFTSTAASTRLPSKAHLESQKLMTVSLSGTWVATVDIQRSYDAGATWQDVESHTANIEKDIETVSDHFIYRLNCTWASGTVNYALAN